MGKASISIAKGKGSMAHNNREFVTENVDRSRMADNITYASEPLEVAYEKCFGKAIEEYNAKQKRADRRIDGVKGYMEQVKHSKNGEKLFYENVVQVGNMQDSHVGTPQGEVCKLILDKFMREFQAKNPNLYVFNAVLHMDEQTPHLHIDYIPLATDYQKGLSVRNSLDRALKQQGIEGKSNKYENRTIMWQNVEKSRIEGIMQEHGLERAEDKGLHASHKSVEYYKTVVNEVHNEVKNMPEQIQSKPTLIGKDKVVVAKADLEQLEERAKLSLVHEQATKQAVAKTKETLADTQQYVTNKMSMALMYQNDAERLMAQSNEELKKAREQKEKYEALTKQQEGLNTAYKKLYKAYEGQKQTITNLQTENTSLKAQIVDLRRSFEERVQQAVEPLQKRIEGLTERLKGMIQTITNTTKAVGMLKYDKGKYKADLTDKQNQLIDAIADYSKKWIEHDGGAELTEEVELAKAEIDSNVGISKGIKELLPQEYPEKLIYKGGDHGRGFYDTDKNFYGGLEIREELKQNNVKIADPYELLPGRGRSH